MLFLGIIVAFILFSVVILIHEWGHFASARKFGVRVEEFGLGIPPRAKKLFTDKKGTLFSLNWLPIGGFVRLTGEQTTNFFLYDKNGKKLNKVLIEKYLKSGEKIYLKSGKTISESQEKEIKEKLKENKASYNLINKSALQQSIIILAGIFMNFVLAVFIFSLLFFVGVKPIGVNDKIETDLNLKLIPTYEQAIDLGLIEIKPGIKLFPIEDSIAEKVGIKQGDILEKIVTKDNEIIIDNVQNLMSIIGDNAGEEINLYISGNESKVIKITPSKEGKIGSYLQENIEINQDFEYKYGIIDSVKYGTIETYSNIMLTFKGLKLLLKNIFLPETPKDREQALEQMSGPIGIVDFISNSVSAGFKFLLILTAIISVNLGVFNLLPIPALDGGRFIFITLNGIVHKLLGKKAIGDNIENIIHVLFFILLIALSIMIGYNDIIKIIER